MNILYYQTDPKIIAGTSLKDSKAPDQGNMALKQTEDPAGVLRNRQDLAADLSISLEDMVFQQQTHSANSYEVKAEDGGAGVSDYASGIPDNDALYTFKPGILLHSLTADCVPVLFYDLETGLIGAVHSGWKGSVQQITSKCLSKITSDHPQVKLENLQFMIGPALSQAKFEVDEDVFQQFAELGYADPFIYYAEDSGKWHIDNQAVVRQEILLAGVKPDQIYVHDMCTFQDQAGFSYRQDKTHRRHSSFIMRSQ